MEIAVAGAGYVGLTSAACFCELGHRVRLAEVDPARVEAIRRGECPFFEPGLPELLERHLGTGLTVTGSLAEAVTGASVLFVCVGTPPRRDGGPDLHALTGLVQSLKALPAARSLVLVLKSTVPPGTCRRVYEWLGGEVPVVSNPEFLRESTAIRDFFEPDRVVIGSPDEAAALKVASLYTGIDAPLLVTGWEESELVSYVTGLHGKAYYLNVGSQGRSG